MSYDDHDAMYEEGMELLYKDFKQNYEQEFIYEKIELFYRENIEVIREPIKSLEVSLELLGREFYTSAFLHAMIAIEVGVKSVALKPIVYSLSINSNASELLFDVTFKRKSLREIPSAYYNIFNDVFDFDFKSLVRIGAAENIWIEFERFQKKRNEVVHQGVFVEMNDAEEVIRVATFICNELIPRILDKFLFHVDGYFIRPGSRDYIERRKIIGLGSYQQKRETE